MSRIDRVASACIAIAAVACGAGPRTAWVERDVPLGQHHESHGADPAAANAAAPPRAIDLRALDAAAIARLDEPTTIAALLQAGPRAPAAKLGLRAARLAFHRGDAAAARTLLARTADAQDAAEVAADVATLTAELREPPVDPEVIAVLLPLTGKFAAIGGELRGAIEMVHAAGTRWLFLDTRGEPDGAAAAVDAAVAAGAIAALGPVGSREAIAAARQATLRGLPIGLLAPDDGADASAGVFRVVSGPGDEARAVAELAARDGFQTVAVFAPRDDVGDATIAAFAEAAHQRGLQLVATGSYDPTGSDVAPDVKHLLGLDPATNPRLAAHLAKDPKRGWQTFSPDVAFSLLYIPDRFDRAAIVAAYLPYFGVELRTTEFPDAAQLARKHGGRIPQVVQLVGGAGWHDPGIALRGGNAVQSAIVVDVFAAELGGDARLDLVNGFSHRFGHPPGAAVAQVFDAAALMVNAQHAAATALEPRPAMRSQLARAHLEGGACGDAHIDASGEIDRDIVELVVEGDGLRVR